MDRIVRIALLLTLLLAACGSSANGADSPDLTSAVDAVADALAEAVPDGTLADLPLDLPAPDVVSGPDALPDGFPDQDAPADLVDLVEPDTGPVVVTPGPEFDRWCGDEPWDGALQAAIVGEVTGPYAGVYNEFPALTMEMMKVIPEHPFYVTAIRIAFAGSGKARIRLMHTFGRSYPASWEDLQEPAANLMEPINVTVTDADPEEWVEIDVADRGIFLEPTEHYMIVYQHFDTAPYVAVADIEDPSEEKSRGLIIVPGSFEPYGLGEANYRMELAGQAFCAWPDEERWFGEVAGLPFAEPGINRAAVGDLNGDGHDDIVAFQDGPRVFFGDGAGQFSAPAEPRFPGDLKSNMTVLADLDNDGDVDAFAPTWTNPDDVDHPNRILLNDGTGFFTVLEASGVESLEPTGAAALGDGNNDGILDIYFGNWLVEYPEAPAYDDRYLVGHGDGTFSDVTEEMGLFKETAQPCYGVSWTDIDNDGWADIWVGNYQFKDNFLFWNQGDGTFIDRAEELGLMKDDLGFWGGHTYGGDWADFDNDGDLDLFEPNLSHPRTMPYSDDSRLLVNSGPPDFTFTDVAPEMGFVYDEGDVNAAWADFDHDRDLDLVIASLYSNHYSKFYRNDGDHFTDITYETGTAVNDAVGAVWLDSDEDGDLDLLLMDRHGAQRNQLFENRVGQDHHWVQFRLTGTTTNRSAVGARVVVTAGGDTMTRLVKGGGRHMNAQDSAVVHFGLGDATTLDSVTVYWPGCEAASYDGLAIDERHELVE